MNITEEELQKCAKCRDIDQVYRLDKPRMPYNSIDNRAWQKFLDSGYVGIQCMMDKFRKIYGWRVAQMKFNPADKSFDATLMQNTKISEVRHVTYEEICKTLWWHSFEIVEKPYMRKEEPERLKRETLEKLVPYTYIKPVPFTYEEKEAAMKPLLDATRKRDEEKAKKSGKKLEDAEEAA